MKANPDYRYDAYVERVLDGDSADMLIDLGFKISIRERIRFFGIDTPETRSTNPEEKKKGLEAKQYVIDAIQGKFVELETTKQGKFGRYLGTIYVSGKNLNEELIAKGMAKEYFGGQR